MRKKIIAAVCAACWIAAMLCHPAWEDVTAASAGNSAEPEAKVCGAGTETFRSGTQETEPVTEAGIADGTEAGSEPDAELKTGPEAGSKPDAESKTGPEAESEPDTESETGTEAESKPDTESETGTELPSFWYAGDYGRKPAVRDQGTDGTCWALTAASALEAALLPDATTEFSADHIVHESAFVTDEQGGGDALMLMAYFSGWQGPVTEAEDPSGDGASPDGLIPAVHVQEMRVLDGAGAERIKEAVRAYGSVQTSLYMNRSTTGTDSRYYKEKNAAYYYNGTENADHSVLILGWDDTYPAENFASDPGMDGAWICQNTWGEDFGEDGIFYVSYADACITGSALAYSRIEETDNYRAIYQNDTCGWQAQQGYDSPECWFACVYTAEAEEMLAAAGFYATGENSAYEVYLVHDFDGTDSFANRELLGSGTLTDAGYYTVDFEELRQLTAGERFAVVVRIVTPGQENPAAVEYRKNEFTQNVTTEGKESYLSQYGGSYWENTQEKFGTNVCLKVYTKLLQ